MPAGAANERPVLLTVGAASRDLDARDARGWRLGGGVTYGSMVAARLGMRVRALVGVDETAAGAPELDLLRAAGVEVQVAPLARGPVFDNRQTPGGRVQHVHQAGDHISTDALPPSWRDCGALLLAPVCGELGDEWAAVVSAGVLVGLGWQGLLRRLVPGQPVEHLPLQPRPLIARADIALVSAEDVAAGGASLADLLPRAGQELAVTDGERGALHLRRTGVRRRDFAVRRVPALPARAVDPTGAGDSFLAAWCAARLAGAARGRTVEEWQALAIGAAVGSAAVESDRLAGLPDVRALCRRLLRPQAADRPPD